MTIISVLLLGLIFIGLLWAIHLFRLESLPRRIDAGKRLYKLDGSVLPGEELEPPMLPYFARSLIYSPHVVGRKKWNEYRTPFETKMEIFQSLTLYRHKKTLDDMSEWDRKKFDSEVERRTLYMVYTFYKAFVVARSKWELKYKTYLKRIYRQWWCSERFALRDLYMTLNYEFREIEKYRTLCDEIHPSKISDFGYWGDVMDSGKYIAGLGQSRDSRSLERANFIAMQAELDAWLEDEGIDNDDDDYYYTIERSSHWAVGWVEGFRVRAFDEDDIHRVKVLPLAKHFHELVESLEDSYPVLDEDLLLEMENEEGVREIEWAARDVLDMDKVPDNLNQSTSMYDHSEYDVEKWTVELHSTMNDMGFDCGYGDSGQAYRDDDVKQAVIQLGWAEDKYYDDDSVERWVVPDDLEENEDGELVKTYGWYKPVSELRTTGDGKYYTPEYFHKHIQLPLPLEEA